MDNTLIDFIKYIWPILLVPLGWLYKQINDLKTDYYETKVHAAETYVSRADYREDLKTLHLKIDTHATKQEAQLSKILDKLDSKADRHK